MAEGRLVLVRGAKGGVGATVVSANLAAALASRGPVLLGSLPGRPSGELGFWFALAGSDAPVRLGEIVRAGAPELLDGVTVPGDGDVRLLRDAEPVDGETAGAFLRLALARYQWVVIDAGSGGAVMDPALAAAASGSSVILVVQDADPVAARRATGAAEALAASGRPVRLVRNRVPVNGRGGAWPVRDGGGTAEGTFPVIGTISEGREVVEGILRGMPVPRAEPRSTIAGDFARLADAVAGFTGPGADAPAPVDDSAYRTPAFRQLKKRLHRAFLERMRGSEPSPETVGRELSMLLAEEGLPDLTPGFRGRLLKELTDEVTGLGPLQDLLDDPDITEVMVNGPEEVYTERKGRIIREPRALDGEEELRAIIERIVAPLGRRVDEASPLVDARLPDGSRVNAVIPPLALKGSALTIRKFSRKRMTMDDLVGFGSITEPAAEFLRAAVAGKLNILISGGTGSGKTTLLNIVASFIGPAERIVTVEDAAELQLPQDHVVRLESRPANLEGKGAITIRDLVRNALRMRPDRIVVGECRGGEALDMLQAMNTGHDGSLSTLHANTPRDALARLETMVLMAGMDLPLRAIREQVASAVDLVVQIARMKDGSRKVTQVTEVGRLEGDVYAMQDIFFRRGDGGLLSSGLVPSVAEKLGERGIPVESSLFN